MLYQKISCTSSGVPRKNQMYARLIVLTIGLAERRMIARTVPRATPAVIEITVSTMVRSGTTRICGRNR